jgi:hypothetical protein
MPGHPHVGSAAKAGPGHAGRARWRPSSKVRASGAWRKAWRCCWGALARPPRTRLPGPTHLLAQGVVVGIRIVGLQQADGGAEGFHSAIVALPAKGRGGGGVHQ